jgi:hypothetical protein
LELAELVELELVEPVLPELLPELELPELVLPEPVPVEEVPPEPLPEAGVGLVLVRLIPLFPGGVAVNVPDAVVAELDPAWVAVKVPGAVVATGGMPLMRPAWLVPAAVAEIGWMLSWLTKVDPACVAVNVPAESVPIFPVEANVVEDAGLATGGMPLMRAGCVTVILPADWMRAVVEPDAALDWLKTVIAAALVVVEVALDCTRCCDCTDCCF